MLNLFSKLPRKKLSKPESVPPPVGGWNVRDSQAAMDPKDAVIMDNIFPMPSDVMVRKGYTQWKTGITGQVETVMSYSSGTTQKLYGVNVNGNIYDVTTTGAVGAAVSTGLTSSRLQHINFTTSGGSYLYAVNGADDPILFDGSSWTNPTIIGVSANNLININAFKERVFFCEKGTLKAWYLGAGAIQGTASAVDLSAFATRGGYLMAMGTWTLDAGAGVDDYAVFVTSEGQVIVYQGTDPSDASKWAMRGVWQLGSPIGRRCLQRFAGDLLLICVDGVVPLSKALISSRVTPRVALTDKIQGAMSTAAQNYASNFGWDMIFCPKNSMLMLNIPVTEGSSQQQFVMNTITGAWGCFKAVYANCWELFQDDAYFGGNGYVGKFWNTLADNGAQINWEAKQAFNYFGSRGVMKHFKEARPIFMSNGAPAIYASLNTDYDNKQAVGILSFTPTTYAVWDTSLWDAGVWGGDLGIITNWQTVGAIGTAAAMHLNGASAGIETHWMATDYVFETGGIVG